jgi:hypothetical protein
LELELSMAAHAFGTSNVLGSSAHSCQCAEDRRVGRRRTLEHGARTRRRSIAPRGLTRSASRQDRFASAAALPRPQRTNRLGSSVLSDLQPMKKARRWRACSLAERVSLLKTPVGLAAPHLPRFAIARYPQKYPRWRLARARGRTGRTNGGERQVYPIPVLSKPRLQ